MPKASEIIADPHNFVFELAAILGFPALVFYLLFAVAAYCVPLVRRYDSAETPEVDREDTQVDNAKPGESKQVAEPVSNPGKKRNRSNIPRRARNADSRNADSRSVSPWSSVRARMAAFTFGLVLAIPLVFVYSYFTEAPFGISVLCCGLPAVLIVVPILWRLAPRIARHWERRPETARAVFRTVLGCIAGAAILNLCAAGGFSYPAIAIPLWTIAALLVNDTIADNGRPREPSARRVRKAAAVLVSCALPVVFAVVVVVPAFKGETLYRECQRRIVGDSSAQLEMLGEFPGTVNAADPYSLPLAQIFFELGVSVYAQIPNYRTRERWEATREHYLAVSPLNSGTREIVGEKELDNYRNYKVTAMLETARSALGEAVALAPRDAKKHALYAIALAESKRTGEAKAMAKRALELDETTPHLDRKLAPKLRAEMEKLER